VGGQIVEMNPAFIPGGLVAEGQPLLAIDPADFRNTLAMRRSELRQAEADLTIEQGRQAVAQREFELLDEQIDPANRSLVLREPQIASIRARVDAAKAAVDQAQLALDRTRIASPFDAKILERSVNLGSQVAPGDELARLVGVDEFWVVATVPLRHLRWLSFPEMNGREAGGGDAGNDHGDEAESEGEGSRVRLSKPDTWGPGGERGGRLKRMIGSVDERTRLARVLIVVDDPLARDGDGPPLVLGSLLETEIEGRPLEGVVRLDRDYVRQGDTVWVMADGKLSIRAARIVFRDADYAYIAEGLKDGDAVVTTTLATVAEGLELKLEGEGEPAGGTDGTGETGTGSGR